MRHILAILFILTLALTADAQRAVAPSVQTPAFPKAVDTRIPSTAGYTVVTVKNSGGNYTPSQFQTCLNTVTLGTVIKIDPDATIVGEFSLPVKTGSGWIEIRTSYSTFDSEFPRGTRLNTTTSAGKLARFETAGNSQYCITASFGAHHYRFIGCEFAQGDSIQQTYGLVQLGDYTPTSVSQLTSYIGIERCYFHGNGRSVCVRGLQPQGNEIYCIDSVFRAFLGMGWECQAINWTTGSGAVYIENNELESTTEGTLIGGGNPRITGLVPSDVIFRRNWYRKRDYWQYGVIRTVTSFKAQPPTGGETGTLVEGVAYLYEIAATGSWGDNQTAVSPASASIKINAPSAGAIKLTWDKLTAENNFTASSYYIYRSSNSGSTWQRITYTPADPTTATHTYVDTNAAGSTNSPSGVGSTYSVKNMFELKNAQRVLVESNVFEWNFGLGQNGTAILFTPRNQDYPAHNAYWTTVRDVTFRNNIVRFTPAGFMAFSYDDNGPNVAAKRIEIYNNLIEGLGFSSGAHYLAYFHNNKQDTEGIDYVRFHHNTVTVDPNVLGQYLVVDGTLTGGGYSIKEAMHYRDNIVFWGYGAQDGSGTSFNKGLFNNYVHRPVVKANVFIGGVQSQIETDYMGNYFPATAADVGFTNYNNGIGGNYALTGASPYKNASTTGADIGADIAQLNTATSGVAPVDTTAPTVTGATGVTSSVSGTYATVFWTTNENSKGFISYGTTSGTYPNTTATESNFNFTHSQVITGLSNTTTYYFKVTLTDPFGNSTQTSEFNFTTGTGGGGGSPVTIVSDTFTETGSDVVLSSHTGETGATWTLHPSYGNSATVDATNDRLTGGAGATAYYSSGVPPSADYSVSFVVRPLDTSAVNGGVTARMSTTDDTMYLARYDFNTQQVDLVKRLSGSGTALGSYATGLSVNTDMTIVLTVNGSSITVSVNGVPRISVTDTDITAAGRIGVRFAGAQSTTSGISIDTILAQTL